jgi:hypothetical protein
MRRPAVDIQSQRSFKGQDASKGDSVHHSSLVTGDAPGDNPSFPERHDREIAEFWTWLRSSELWRLTGRSWAAEFWSQERRFVREICYWVLREHITRPNVRHLAESIAILHADKSDSVNGKTDMQAPIFLLCTGWRTGSTLLQRILVTDPRLFIWGEPLGEMTLVSRITELVSDYSSPRNLNSWRTQPSFDNLASSCLATSWIATLSPRADDFRLALRSLFDRWLGEPAQRGGCARWGFKEVRLGAAEASLLYWLYPHAKFVILSRHPYDCYLSLADANYHPLYYKYPRVRVDSAAGFARHWNQLAVSWSELPEGFPCFHVRYEDLTSRKFDFRKLESWLGIEIREDIALSAVVGHTSTRPRLSWYERMIIAREAASGMRALGYSK